jgi:hypothetical protein
MPYTKTINNNNETIFEVIPNKVPSIFNALLLPLLIPLIILFAINIFIFLLVVAALAVCLYLSQKSNNVNRYRTNSFFSVIENGVKYQNIFFKREDIHRLLIRSHVNERYVYVPARLSYEQPGNAHRGLKLRQKLIAVSYRVDMELNGKPHTLDGGIDEPTAYALLQDVSKGIHFENR